MEKWLGKVAVVTGASAGIGAAISVDLIKSGMIVIGLARREDKILALKEQLSDDAVDRLYAFKCDVSKVDDIKAAFKWIKAQFNRVDVLINNAGVLRTHNLLDNDNTDALREVIDTNVMGAALCAREAFQVMKENDGGHGHIIMMNSMAGHKVCSNPKVPTFNLYYSSKFAITAMTEVLRLELEMFNANIRISVRY